MTATFGDLRLYHIFSGSYIISIVLLHHHNRNKLQFHHYLPPTNQNISPSHTTISPLTGVFLTSRGIITQLPRRAEQHIKMSNISLAITGTSNNTTVVHSHSLSQLKQYVLQKAQEQGGREIFITSHRSRLRRGPVGILFGDRTEFDSGINGGAMSQKELHKLPSEAQQRHQPLLLLLRLLLLDIPHSGQYARETKSNSVSHSFIHSFSKPVSFSSTCPLGDMKRCSGRSTNRRMRRFSCRKMLCYVFVFLNFTTNELRNIRVWVGAIEMNFGGRQKQVL